MIHPFAALAEKERALISQRTKAALSAAKARGQKLGNPNISAAREAGATALKANADRHAANVPEERRKDVAGHRRRPQRPWHPDAPRSEVGGCECPERAGQGLTPSLRGLAIFAFFAVFLPVPG
jgi:hypothetical protein